MCQWAYADHKNYNGFDLSNSMIDSHEIYHGGPKKDGIPAIDNPKFVLPSQADFINPEDRILGLTVNGISKAYPIKLLNYHEIVNDFFEDKAIVITYCPLCASGMAFSSKIKQKNTTFGVSGLLYNSDVLLYDRETQSLWSQLLSKAISGPLKGTQLHLLPLAHTTWKDWLARHPNTLLLSNKTGYLRNYNVSPYGGYHKSTNIYFPVNPFNKQYHPKEWVLGVKMGKKTKVYPFAELAKIPSPFQDAIDGKKVTIKFDAPNRTARIYNQKEQEIPSTMSYWFAWMSFFPDSEVFKADK